MLTPSHIARITSPAGTGSGCVIAPHLLLTSAHVVPDVGAQVWFFTAQDENTHTGTVVWRGTPHGRDDAALVKITSPTWNPPPTMVRWGRLVTPTPGATCHTWGFPDLVQRPGRAVETSQLSGTVNPGTRMVGDRYVMGISSHPPVWEEGGSPWAGLSGAALVSDELVVGVAATDPAHHAHAALEAIPAYVLHHNPDFRAVLAEHSVSLVLEPVELQQAAHHEPATNTPAGLLRARHQVVDFHGRTEILQELHAWCAEDEAFSALLVHGPGGQGKTRLAQELTNQLTHPDYPGRGLGGQRPRWAVLWLAPQAPPAALAPLAQVEVPLLIVVDYAETRTARTAEGLPAQLTTVLQACAQRTQDVPVRVLLLARTNTEWWTRLPSTSPAAGELLESATDLPLEPLTPQPTDRGREYRLAAHQLARSLPTIARLAQVDWARIAEQLPQPDLRACEWDTVLSVHMRALADLLDSAHTDHTPARHHPSVEARLLQHEERYWDTAASTHGLDQVKFRNALRDVLAIAFVLTPIDPSTALELIQRTGDWSDQDGATHKNVYRWIRALYPPTEHTPWGLLQPDRLLEHFLGQRLAQDPHLLDTHLDGISETEAVRLVTLYSRAAAHPALAGLEEHLIALCARHIALLGPAIIDTATQVEHPEPLITALDDATTSPDTSLEVLLGLDDALPGFSQRLAGWSERLSTRLVHERQERAAQDPDAYLPDLATSLNNQSIRLGALGRAEEALDAITQAVRHYQALAEHRPDTHLPDLAMALNNQAVDLGNLGRAEEALDAITQAVNIRRTLAELFRAGFFRGSEPTLRPVLKRIPAGRSGLRTPLAAPARSRRADGGG